MRNPRLKGTQPQIEVVKKKGGRGDGNGESERNPYIYILEPYISLPLYIGLHLYRRHPYIGSLLYRANTIKGIPYVIGLPLYREHPYIGSLLNKGTTL